MAGLIWISVAAIVSFLGYLVTPDSSPFANHQQLSIAVKQPGFSIERVHIRENIASKRTTIPGRMFRGEPMLYHVVPIQSYRFDGDLLIYETYMGEDNYPGMQYEVYLWDVIYALPGREMPLQKSDSLFRITDIYGNEHLRSITSMRDQVAGEHIKRQRFLLGTDRFGRDMLSQLIIGMRVSLSVGFIAVTLSLLIGLILGSLAGYYRGRTDDLIVWLINVVWSIPTLLLVIAITFALGKGFWQVFVAVGLTMWVEVARVVRGQVISLREKEFVEAARALGIKSMRIISRHILPVIIGPVIVISAANFASAILIEAGLSFLGIGVQPPMPSWGSMIREHYGYVILDKGYLAFLPGMMIMITVLAFMVTGNGLKDATDHQTVLMSKGI